MPDTQEILQSHSERLTQVESRVSNHEKHLEKLDRAISTLQATVASKEDIAEVNRSINELTRGALNAVPEHAANRAARQSAMWAAVTAIATIGMLIAFMVHRG